MCVCVRVRVCFQGFCWGRWRTWFLSFAHSLSPTQSHLQPLEFRFAWRSTIPYSRLDAAMAALSLSVFFLLLSGHVPLLDRRLATLDALPSPTIYTLPVMTIVQTASHA